MASGQRAAVIEGVRLRSYFSSQGQELGTSVVMQQAHLGMRLNAVDTPHAAQTAAGALFI